jgi:uncharacterized protein
MLQKTKETRSKKILCIYHHNCADGFGAALIVQRYYGEGNVEFFGGVHGDAPPNIAGREVLIVDFSYPLDTLRDMADKAESLLVLDHHKSARDALSELPFAGQSLAEYQEGHKHRRDSGRDWAALFDMERSGAGLVWDFFYPYAAGVGKRPRMIDHIEDRDLWRFNLPHTKEIQSVIFSHPYDFETWFFLAKRIDFEDSRKIVIQEGAAIQRKHDKDINELLLTTQRKMVIAGFEVPVANLPYTMASDAGHIMAKSMPFAATYFDTENHRVFSLRSSADGEDVSAIAKKYGGGGHRNAAGFRVPLGWEGDSTARQSV